MAISTTDKPVRRRTTVDTIFDKGKHRRIIIMVGGGKDPDIVRFRLDGLRDVTDGVSLKELFWLDFKRTTMRRWETENEKRKADGKRRLKRPTFLKSR